MYLTGELKQRLYAGEYDDMLCKLYVTEDAAKQRNRLADIISEYEALFGETQVELFSAPGRTELGGNHTDHQNGCVLAASVNLDIVACAAANGTNIIRIQSEGYPMEEISLDELEPKPEERNGTAALIRGVAAAISQRGYSVGGFDAYAASDVLSGSGLSSSAAYEVLIGVILNHLFCQDELDAVELAQIGQYAENVFFGKPCGLLDQMASSVGNIVAIDFADENALKLEKIPFSFSDCGYALCIIDSGANHADLTDEYAAVPQEMKAVAACFGKKVLREVPESEFFSKLPKLRESCGDRAVLRAAHFYAENSRAQQEAEALRQDDFETFCQLAKESGRSSFMYLQNVYCGSMTRQQAVAVALMQAERLLEGKGAFRVHGGGFAGTIQAFVPNDKVEGFRQMMDAVLSEGSCHILSIRPAGGVVLTDM